MLAKKAIPINEIGSFEDPDFKTRRPLRKEIVLIIIALLILFSLFP
ncbi:hypothetical protein [Desulfosporosinus shakirovi]|nr:hypothetical protein [Desulfosporosinus sp. SRJS8]MCB8816102.1 hypothetical protein [Desulfosporosinus sp. SRJS8]